MSREPRANWRCRHGIHRWTKVPRRVAELVAKGGCPGPPDWYVGRTAEPYCWRCRVKRGGEGSP